MVRERQARVVNHTINIQVSPASTKGMRQDNMAKSKLRGGKKAHNKRVQERNKDIKKNEVIVEALKRKIYEEAKQRYLTGETKQAIWNIS